MTPTETPGSSVQALIQALKTVPEARLRLVELAWECAGEDGRLDLQKASVHMKEIEEAVQQVNTYTSATQRVWQCLQRLQA